LGNVTSFTHVNLVTGKTYIYRVSAINSIGTGNPSPEVLATPTSSLGPPAVPSTITVSTDKPVYDHNSLIMISGHVTNPYPGQDVALKITSPSGNVVSTSQSSLDTNGYFHAQASTIGNLWFENGQYTVAIQNGNDQAIVNSTTFQLTGVGPVIASPPMTVLTDKSSYGAGDSITISGQVGSVIPGKAVSIQILNFDNNLSQMVSAYPGQDGKYSTTITPTGEFWKQSGTFTLQAQYTTDIIAPLLSFYFNSGNITPPVYGSDITIATGAGASASADCVTTNNCYSPNPLNVVPGTTVTWTNTDKTSHTVTSGKVSDDNSGSLFDSSLLKPGKTFQFTFYNSGTYNYFCTVHPWMVGQVIVGNGVQPPPSTITAATDKSSYSTGDSIVVSGTVNPVNSINPQKPVTIQTYDLYNVLVRIDMAIPSQSGQFSATIPAHGPSWQNSGTYALKIQYDQPSSASKLSFYFNSGTVTPPGSAEVTIATGAGASVSAACVAANNCFSPTPAYVSPGTTVTWSNTDKLSHTVTSGRASDNDAGSLYDSGLIKTGKTFQFTFYNSGTYNYFCTVHPWMVGQVIVGNGVQPPTNGTIIPPINPVPTPTDIKVGTDRTLYYGGDTVSTTIVLSGANAGQNIAISFNDPTGNTIISRTVTTDNTGMATSQFKVPITAKAGTYQVVVTSSVNSKEFNASSQFTIQQRIDQVSIISVQATDQQGNQVSSFTRGSTGYVKVVLSAQTSIPSLATVNLFDSDYTTLGIGSFKTNLAIGQSTVILSFPIPNDAIVGTGNIYTDVFTDWPSNGGKPLTGESAAMVEIK
ncbi:MAG: hypothetical protein D4R72_02595, partial [Nitrosopumilales archaeon]